MIKVTKKTIFYGIIILVIFIVLCKEHYSDYIDDIKNERQNKDCHQDDMDDEIKKLVKKKINR